VDDHVVDLRLLCGNGENEMNQGLWRRVNVIQAMRLLVVVFYLLCSMLGCWMLCCFDAVDR
jgi:hypothetical protein